MYGLILAFEHEVLINNHCLFLKITVTTLATELTNTQTRPKLQKWLLMEKKALFLIVQNGTFTFIKEGFLIFYLNVIIKFFIAKLFS